MKYILKLIFLNRFVIKTLSRIWHWTPSVTFIPSDRLFSPFELINMLTREQNKELSEKVRNQYNEIFYIHQYNKKDKTYTLKAGFFYDLSFDIIVDRKEFHYQLNIPLKIQKSN